MGETVASLVAQAGGGGPGLLQIALFMIPMFAIMYFLMIRPERKKQAEAQSLLGALKKGDEVALTSGFIGKILAVEEKTVTVEIADKTKVRVLKQAVMGPSARYLTVQPPKGEPAAAAAAPPSGDPAAIPDADKSEKSDKSDKSDKKSA
ncbi:MAG TPA: preprotein translocase subunit YajC [Myxococcota bacterium]|jgi:preprotein translocase subunit YajC